jgi:amidohydrolase
LTDAALRSQIVPLRRHLHQHPEIGFQEHDTSRHVRHWLQQRGFDVVGPFAGTGFYVEVTGAQPGPTIGYRTELDGLPMEDQKSVSYRSKRPGAAHLCGHDAHMAVACGVALLLKERADEIQGAVRVFFQPNEESSPSGAAAMIEAGILNDLSAAYCIHVDPSLSTGRYGLKRGALTAAATPFVVRIQSGQAGHSARPHETVDTVWLAVQILQQFYQLAGRIHDARQTAVLTACTFKAGEAMNVIPDAVEFGGTLRCASREGFRQLRKKMRKAAGALGAVYGADVEVEFVGPALPPVVNDDTCIDRLRRAIESRFGREAVRELAQPSMGGEDFAFYSEHVPSALLRVGTACSPDTRFPLHHTRFDVDESALPMAAHLMSDVLVIDLAERHALDQAESAEHEEREPVGA